jgi:hypothetical protein
MLETKVLITLLIFSTLLAGCTEAKPKTPEEELVAYGKSVGQDWEKKRVSALFFGAEIETERLKKLSPEALSMVKRITMESVITEVPDLSFLPSLTHLSFTSGSKSPIWKINDIHSLAGLKISYLVMGRNPVRDIGSLASCENLESVGLDGTLVESLPNLKKWKRLKSLGLTDTPIRTLDNLDTIPSDFDLYLWNCKELTNIDALLDSRVNTLIIDKKKKEKGEWSSGDESGTYDRFEGWFKEHLADLKAKRPQFNLKFDRFE